MTGKKLIKRLILITAILSVAASAVIITPARASGASWAIYWYLCGSDLETDDGAATLDLVEAANAQLPDNVKLVIMAGGALEWDNDAIGSDALYLLEHTGDDIEVVGTRPLRSMGDPGTLRDFIQFCEENYPADRKALILWNHGGGSGGGICYDEIYDMDFISFEGMKGVFESLYGRNPRAKPFDILGFDACLMATLDMAGLAAPYADYLVASEEYVPGYGWNYTGILNALARNPGMSGRDLGRVICDTYAQDCREYGVADEITLSVIDLSKVELLDMAVSMMFAESLLSILNEDVHLDEFFADFGRGVRKADTYSQGSGMVDLGSLAAANANLFPEAAEMIADAINESVVYQVTGPYRKNSNGIAVYFPSLGDAEGTREYAKSSAAGGMKSLYYLYEPLLNGGMSDEGMNFFIDFVSSLESGGVSFDLDAADVTPAQPQQQPGTLTAFGGGFQFTDTSDMGFDDHPIELVEDEDGIEYFELNLGPQKARLLKSVTFMLAVCDDEGIPVAFLGEDADTAEDWENGVFWDNFRGIWGSIDGHLVTMFVKSITDEYILYEVPLMIEGRLYNLTIAYDIEDVEYRMLTARLDESETAGLSPRGELLLSDGDVVTTVFHAIDLENEDTVLFENETFSISSDSAFEEMELDDGYYVFMYLMTDYDDNIYYSDMAYIEIEDGYIFFHDPNA